MPIMDPSIYQNAFHPTVALQYPTESMARTMAIGNAMQQGQMQALQLKQAKRDAQDQENLRTLMASGGYKTPGELADAAQATGNIGYGTIMKLRQADTDHQMKVAQLSEALGKVEKAKRDAMSAAADDTAKLAAGAQDPDSFNKGLFDLAKRHAGVLGPLQVAPDGNPILPATLQKYFVSPADGHDSFQQKRSLAITNAMPVLDAVKMLKGEDKDTGTSIVNIKRDALGNVVGAPTTVLEKDIGPGDLKKFASDIGAIKEDGSIDLTNPKVQAKIKAMTTNMATVINNGPGGSAADYSKPLPDKGMEAVAQAIYRGEQPLLEYSVRQPANAIINARAAAIAESNGKTLKGKIEIAARASGLKDFEPGGTSGKTIVALNTMTEHLNTGERLAQALQNGDVQLFNRIRQEYQKQTGNPAPTDFATLRQFLAGEVAKVATGGHLTEGEIKNAADRLSSAQSPAQLAGALATMREIAGGKLVALDQDYKRLTGKSLADAGRLTPATAAAFKDASKRINAGESKDPQPKGNGIKFSDKWQEKPAGGNPDLSTNGKNPRFPTAVWVGAGAPDGGGWYVRLSNGNVRRVE